MTATYILSLSRRWFQARISTLESPHTGKPISDFQASRTAFTHFPLHLISHSTIYLKNKTRIDIIPDRLSSAWIHLSSVTTPNAPVARNRASVVASRGGGLAHRPVSLPISAGAGGHLAAVSHQSDQCPSVGTQSGRRQSSAGG